METKTVIGALAALAQESRLSIFRLLVQAGPQGAPAGAIGAKLGLPPATLSFHLAQLHNAGLVASQPNGRFVIYSADFRQMADLIAFLTENCCGGADCGPIPSTTIPRKGTKNETISRARRR